MSEHVDGGITFDATTRTEDLRDGEGTIMTSYATLAIEELGFGLEVRRYGDGPVGACADATAEWQFASPDGLRELATAFRTRYADAIDAAADTWAQRIADGTIPAPEA